MRFTNVITDDVDVLLDYEKLSFISIMIYGNSKEVSVHPSYVVLLYDDRLDMKNKDTVIEEKSYELKKELLTTSAQFALCFLLRNTKFFFKSCWFCLVIPAGLPGSSTETNL